MKIYSVAIIGGGFSGLTLASMLAKNFKRQLLIIEGGKRIGKKILATGNGQGNITNENVSEKFYHGDVKFAKTALQKFSNTQLLNYFYSLGLVTVNDNGKYYPASYTAGAILDVLRFEIEKHGVEIATENYCVNVKKEEYFTIECENGNCFFARKVVFAFGAKSGAGFLTDGKSFSLAKNFNHTVTSLWPSLVQLKTEREKIRGLKGLKVEAKVGLYSDKTHICEFSGDLLFTDYGISGNAVFALSAYLKNVKNPIVKIQFLPTFDSAKLFEILCEKAQNNITNEKLLISLLPTRLSQTVLKVAGVLGEQIANKKSVSLIVDAIKRFTLKVEGTSGFESSQVTAGGIDTKDIDVNSMQSKLVKDLYIIGEALNVDGDCGGYNLQWAFTSASICAEALNEKN